MINQLKQQYPNIFFQPVEMPVYVDGKMVPHRKAILRDDNRDVLSIVSDKYVPVSNETTVQHFINMADAAGIPYDIKGGASYRNGCYSALTVDFPTKTVTVNKTDVSHLRAWLSNGFDGFNSARLDMGFFRLVCSNGAGVYQKETTSVLRHVGQVNTKLVDAFKGYVEESCDVIIDLANNLTNLTFPDIETVKATIGDNETWLPKKYSEEILSIWADEGQQGLNGWTIYNAFTSVFTHKVASDEVKTTLMKQFDKKVHTEWGIPRR